MRTPWWWCWRSQRVDNLSSNRLKLFRSANRWKHSETRTKRVEIIILLNVVSFVFFSWALKTCGDAHTDLPQESLLLLGGGVGEQVRPVKSEAHGMGEHVLGVLGVGEQVLLPLVLQFGVGAGVRGVAGQVGLPAPDVQLSCPPEEGKIDYNHD